MKTRISTKGQVVIPAEVRRQDRIEAGQEFEFERIDEGDYRLKRSKRRRNEGLLKLLFNCPVKDWYRPLEMTETTDDIVIPEFE